MTKTFTQNDLIRFIYQETTEEEAQEISRALNFDQELQLLFRQLVISRSALDEAALEPSSASINNILDYARGLEVKH